MPIGWCPLAELGPLKFIILESSKSLSYAQWDTKCQDKGGNLASVNNAKQQAKALKALRGTKRHSVLTGMKRKDAHSKTFVDAIGQKVRFRWAPAMTCTSNKSHDNRHHQYRMHATVDMAHATGRVWLLLLSSATGTAVSRTITDVENNVLRSTTGEASEANGTTLAAQETRPCVRCIEVCRRCGSF